MAIHRPFLGLRPFDYADREFFFGRQEQIYALYRLIDRSRFVAVVGSSGSGKSSLVRAGLLALLDEESAEEGCRNWTRRVMRPGTSPIATLAKELATLTDDEDSAIAEARGERLDFDLRRSSFGLAEALAKIPELESTALLLVVDQFEELFRYASPDASTANEGEPALSRDEAAHFVQLLLEGARASTREIHIVITMRSDFIGDCARFHGLPEAVSGAQFLVPALTRDQLEEAITQPLAKLGASIEPALVERLLNDCSEDRDQLPVLQHCLLRLWESSGGELDHAGPSAEEEAKSDARQLTMVDYVKIGELRGALSQHAEKILAGLPGYELAVEQIFRALSEMDREGRAVRRALPFSQLLAETGVRESDLRTVLDRFRRDDCSFLTTSPPDAATINPETLIDVGHEALLWRWERMSGGASAPGSAKGQASQGWLADEHDDGLIYRGLLTLLDQSGKGTPTLPLRQVEKRWRWWTSRPRTAAWAARYGGKFTEVEKLFAASRRALDAERRRVERERKIVWASAGGFGVSFILICGLLGFAWRQYQKADDAYLAVFNSYVELAKQIDKERGGGGVTASGFKSLLKTLGTASENLLNDARSPKARVLGTRLKQHVFDGYYNAGDKSEALKIANFLEESSKQLLAADPENPELQALRYESLFRLGDALEQQALHEAALSSYRLAFDIAKRLSEKNFISGGQNLVFMEQKIGEALQNEGEDLQKKGEAPQSERAFREADDWFKQAIGAAKMLVQARPDDLENKRLLAIALRKSGKLLSALAPSDPSAAINAFDGAINILDEMLRIDGADEKIKSNLAEAHALKAHALAPSKALDSIPQDRKNQAMSEYEISIDQREPLVNKNAGSYQGLNQLAEDLEQLSRLYAQIGNNVKAVSELERASEDVNHQLACFGASISSERHKSLDDLMKHLAAAETALRVAPPAPALTAPLASAGSGSAKAKAIRPPDKR